MHCVRDTIVTVCKKCKFNSEPLFLHAGSIFRGEDVFGEKYGPNSVCLQQGRGWEKMFTTGTRTTSTLSVGSFGGGCYEVRL